MIESMGGRKVLLLLLCIGIAITAMVLKGDVPAGLADFLKYIFGIFVIGNGIEHAATASSDKAASMAEAHKAVAELQAPAPPVTVDTELSGKLDTVLQSLNTNNQGIAFLVDRVMGKNK